MSVHFDFANGKFVYTWQVISDDGTKYFTSDGQLVDKKNLIPSAATLAFLEYTTASVSSFQLKSGGTVNYDVDWGDGSTETGVTTNEKDHTYSTAGVYRIKITPAEGSTFRPLQYGATDGTTSLAKVAGLGGSQFGSSLINAWRDVSSLTSFGAIDTSSVTSFTRAWANCSGLTTFPQIDTSNGTTFSFAWNACSGLTSFPALDFSSATEVGQAWNGCSNLVSFPSVDFSSVTSSFRRTWYQCTSLTTYPANQFDNIQTTASNGFEDAWRSCALTAQSIENILTSLDTNGASNITLGFVGGTNASASTWSYDAVDAYVDLANKGWTITQNSHLGLGYTISNSGTSFELRSTGTVDYDVDWGDGSAVETSTANNLSHTYATSGTYKITINSNSGVYRPKFNSSGEEDQITSVVYAGTNSNTVGTSLDAAFKGANNMTEYKQINASTTASVTNFSNCWRDCSGLTSFPQIDTSSGTTFSFAWLGCTGLTSFPLIDTSSGTLMRSAWQNCSGLTSFPSIDTSNVTNPRDAWNGCSGLTSFPALDLSSGTDFRGTWRGCTGITAFPSITPTSGTDFGGAWFNCTSLATYPANQFDTTGTLVSGAFSNTFSNCALTAQSIENILTSLDTNGSTNVTLNIDGGTNAAKSTWSSAANTAYTNLINNGWTITYNS